MNKKGFTLVELMAVIILIGLLALIVSVPVNKLINETRNKLNNDQKRQIEISAESWAIDNPYMVPPFTENKTETTITIDELFNSGYLDTEIVNMIDDNKIKACSYVKITLKTDSENSNKNVYSYQFVEMEEC